MEAVSDSKQPSESEGERHGLVDDYVRVAAVALIYVNIPQTLITCGYLLLALSFSLFLVYDVEAIENCAHSKSTIEESSSVEANMSVSEEDEVSRVLIRRMMSCADGLQKRMRLRGCEERRA